jgi:hypothetical protein
MSFLQKIESKHITSLLIFSIGCGTHMVTLHQVKRTSTFKDVETGRDKTVSTETKEGFGIGWGLLGATIVLLK